MERVESLRVFHVALSGMILSVGTCSRYSEIFHSLSSNCTISSQSRIVRKQEICLVYKNEKDQLNHRSTAMTHFNPMSFITLIFGTAIPTVAS